MNQGNGSALFATYWSVRSVKLVLTRMRVLAPMLALIAHVAAAQGSDPGVYVIDERPESSRFQVFGAGSRPEGLASPSARFEQERVSYHPFAVANQWFFQTLVQVVSLLQWNFVPGQFPNPPEKYNRLKHFGRWIKDRRTPTDCRDTRSRVLERESRVPVSFTTPSNCAVANGEWFDPLSGQVFYSARELEIDHTVPIKNAYDKGAWAWDDDTRCVFFNFMGNRTHLMAISKRENRVKQDGGPDRYMPPRAEYACQYLYNWLAVKLIWNIPMGQSEATAIHQLIQTHSCQIDTLRLSAHELQEQRQEIINARRMCQVASVQPRSWQ